MTTRDKIIYGKDNTPISQLLTDQCSSPIRVIGNSYMSNYKNYYENMISENQKVVEYRVVLEPVKTKDISNVGRCVLALEDEYRLQFKTKEISNPDWKKWHGNHIYLNTITTSDMMNFLSNENYSDYKYFCLISLRTDNEYRKSNITSKLIESGRSVDVGISKSKTNKDAYVVFNPNSNNYENVGVIFFKEQQSYSMLRLSLDEKIRFFQLKEIEYKKV